MLNFYKRVQFCAVHSIIPVITAYVTGYLAMQQKTDLDKKSFQTKKEIRNIMPNECRDIVVLPWLFK